jgi:ribosomal protein L30/L7E
MKSAGESNGQSTHLKVVSALRLHKLATIHCSSLARHLDTLEASQQARRVGETESPARALKRAAETEARLASPPDRPPDVDDTLIEV